eukprot:snap_masked-scaffold_26-processed-gene-1.20-mRNA-1 protein AED:1.00 eAED:1.00 QI:0/-1/0/0/-1/1/1/0/382
MGSVVVKPMAVDKQASWNKTSFWSFKRTGKISYKRRVNSEEVMDEQGEIFRAEFFKVVLLGNENSGKSVLFSQMVHLGHTQQKQSPTQHPKNCDCCIKDTTHSLIWSYVLRMCKDLVQNVIIENNEKVETFSKEEIECLLKNLEECLKAVHIKPRALTQVQNFLPSLIRLSQNLNILDLAFRYPENSLENLSFFAPRFAEIFSKSYHPQFEDVLRAKYKTSGASLSRVLLRKSEVIKEDGIEDGILDVEGVDIGGSRPERRKWELVLDDCWTVCFIVSAMEFENHNYENIPCLDLFDNYNQVKDDETHVVTIISKIDLLKEKYKTSPEKYEEKMNMIRDLLNSRIDQNQIKKYTIKEANLLNQDHVLNTIAPTVFRTFLSSD